MDDATIYHHGPSGYEDANTDRMSSVDGALERCNKAKKSIGALISELTERLHTVMRPEAPEVAKEADAGLNAVFRQPSPIVGQLNMHADDLDHLANLLAVVIERLDT